ncbi:hypothetical protein [Chitinophaga silvatica]|nr:hypothetical protein [Chitinophaga silvatica]
MEDSIWASIEKQLDMDLNQPATQATPPSKGRSGYGYMGLIAITAAITFFGWYYFHNTNNTPITPTPNQTIPIISKPAEIQNKTDNIKAEKEIYIPPVNKQETIKTLDSLRKNEIIVDSIFISTPTPVKIDSTQQGKVPDRVFNLDTMILEPKRIKGIKGIGPDDYRISVKKDSTKSL